MLRSESASTALSFERCRRGARAPDGFEERTGRGLRGIDAGPVTDADSMVEGEGDAGNDVTRDIGDHA